MDSKQFLQLLDDITKKKQSLFITGPAGVGKTHLLTAIYNSLKARGEKIVLTSTTGISALNLGGITIHKLMGLQNHSDMGYIGFMKSSFLFRGISMRMTKVDYIIIDEVSMLRADTFELINEILKQVTQSNKPFGGKVMIFTGDFYQIPPVVKSWEKKQNQWLFTSPSWLAAKIKTIHLTDVYRQEDKNFVAFLNDIRTGKWNPKTAKVLEQCVGRKIPKDTTVFFSTNEECDEFNMKRLKDIDGKMYTFEAEIKGKRNHKYKHDKEAIVRDCIAKVTLSLKVGAKVIAICNDPKGRFMNGSVGYVTACDEKNYIVSVKFEGCNDVLKLRRHQWARLGFDGRPKAKFKQVPLLPAYALTIHKSQGMTLDAAVIDCKNIFACGQLYVALSRVRNLENLKVLNFHKSQIIVSDEVKKFYSELNKMQIK
ncbi:MAG: AAA family ATPase [Mycoplasmataceae bacterium]|nr:AAA family ATPase [Mycoplasmataceae bacterium]